MPNLAHNSISSDIFETASENTLESDPQKDAKKDLQDNYQDNSQNDSQSVQAYALPHSIAENIFVVNKIQELLKNGTLPNQIAIIARKHKDLEDVAKALSLYKIPVNYDRKQNVLEIETVRELVRMIKFIFSLNKVGQTACDEFLPEILQYPFWELSEKDVWKLSIYAYKNKVTWLEAMQDCRKIEFLENPEKMIEISNFFLQIAKLSISEPAERIFDLLMGVNEKQLLDDDFAEEEESSEVPEEGGKEAKNEILEQNDQENAVQKETSINQNLISFQSPFKKYYFDEKVKNLSISYLQTLSGLSALINAIRAFQTHKTVYISDVISYLNLLEFHQQTLQDTSVFGSPEKGVNVLTAHHSKGLEFDTVFLIRAVESHWFKTTKSERLGHPINLPLLPEKDNLDDKLRLFFVASTRAKKQLIITYPLQSLDKKWLNPVSVIPDKITQIPINSFNQDQIAILANKINSSNFLIKADTHQMLDPLVANYQLSATHLLNFLDTQRGGPANFLQHNILRFPQAKSNSSAYGTAMHAVMKWWHDWQNLNPKNTILFEDLFAQFSRLLDMQRLLKLDFEQHLQKGKQALLAYYTNKNGQVLPNSILEKSFKYSGVVIGKNEAKITGQIDKMNVNFEQKTIEVTDFKTGKPIYKWSDADSKSWKYQTQLTFYKMLVENSREYSNFTVNQTSLEFLDSGIFDESNHLAILEKNISLDEVLYLAELCNAVYHKIINLDFPDITNYSADLKGTKQFAQDLIDKKI